MPFHSDSVLLVGPRAESKIRQGRQVIGRAATRPPRAVADAADGPNPYGGMSDTWSCWISKVAVNVIP